MPALNDLLDLVSVLRDPGRGDPWHQAQDFSSIAPCTIEEAYEVADAIERQNMSDLCMELGDLLLQVIYHAQLAGEKGFFTFTDVVDALDRKLRTRESVTAVTPDSPAGHVRLWHQAKLREQLSEPATGNTSILDDIPLNQPALGRAQKLQTRAAMAGFDWKNAVEVLNKIEEEISELEEEMQDPRPRAAIKHELGDVIFACVNLARHLGIDAEAALRSANHRFEQRFRYIEDRLRERNLAPDQVGLDELDRLWEEAKKL